MKRTRYRRTDSTCSSVESGWKTMASASMKNTSIGSSSPFSVCTSAENMKGPAWVWQSVRRSSDVTEGKSPHGVHQGRGQPLSSHCPFSILTWRQRDGSTEGIHYDFDR